MSLQDQLSRSAARSAALGAVPAPVNVGEPPQLGYRVHTVAPFSTLPINGSGDYLFLLNAIDSTGEPVDSALVSIRDNNGNSLPLDQIQKGYVFPRRFEYLQLVNNGFQSLTVQFYIGSGRIEQQSADVRTSPLTNWVTASFQRPNDVLAYAANQILSTTVATAPLVFNNIGRYSSTGGQIIKAKLRINGTANIANANFTLWLFNASPGTFVDKAAFAPQSVDIDALQGIINFPAQITGGAGSTATVGVIDGIQVRFRSITNKTLWGLLVANAAYVPVANSNLKVELYTEDFLPSVVASSVIVQP